MTTVSLREMGWRDLVPSRDFVIETSWSPEVAALEIKKTIGPRRWFGGGDSRFVGASTGGPEFWFCRRISYRNPSLPMIHAVVERSRHDGARIRVHMRMHVAVIVFMSVWMTGATLGGLACLVRALLGKPAALVGVLLPLFGVAFVGIPFALEAEKAEGMLREMFAAAPARVVEEGPYRS